MRVNSRTAVSFRSVRRYSAAVLLCALTFFFAIPNSLRAQQIYFPIHTITSAEPTSIESESAADTTTGANAASLPDAIQPQMQSPAQRAQSQEPINPEIRAKEYFWSIFGLAGVLGPPAGAAIGQWRNTPPEWGQGADGYGRRVASGYARNFFSQTIRFGVAWADGEDPRFWPSEDSGFWPRTKHAVMQTFVSRTASGGRMPAISRLGGIYGAAFISNTWYPASHNSAGDALERGSTTLGSTVGWSVFHEFWPDIKKSLHHKK